MLNSTDSSSEDEQRDRGVAMQVVSDSDNDEVEINPYWCRIIVDKLQGLGNPIVVDKNIDSDTDSMPGLEPVSDSETSVQFIYTPPPSPWSAHLGSVEHEMSDCMEKLSLNKKDYLMVLLDDEGEDGYTTFTAAMLVNVEGDVEGIQMELYNLGASCHMSPYRDHFKNYVAIALKSITAADKCHFQAIGRGDLHIKIPNGHGTTTILLKDVLHCPEMGLTLVSIGKITAAGYKVIFRGPICKIFDQKDKIIGLIPVKNGLYHVDHDVFMNVAMAGEVREVLTLEDLHRRMGHIAPEAAKQMVSIGAVDGIKLDLTSTIQSCNFCKYATTTRKPITKTRVTPWAKKFGEKIHSDIWGPLPVKTPGQKQYYVSFMDDYTRWTHLVLLASKDQTFEEYCGFEAWAKL